MPASQRSGAKFLKNLGALAIFARRQTLFPRSGRKLRQLAQCGNTVQFVQRNAVAVASVKLQGDTIPSSLTNRNCSPGRQSATGNAFITTACLNAAQIAVATVEANPHPGESRTKTRDFARSSHAASRGSSRCAGKNSGRSRPPSWLKVISSIPQPASSTQSCSKSGKRLPHQHDIGAQSWTVLVRTFGSGELASRLRATPRNRRASRAAVMDQADAIHADRQFRVVSKDVFAHRSLSPGSCRSW